MREINNELGASSIFGYKTWWLSTDTLTYKAIDCHFHKDYEVSCYMRPDFLYNYISLSPKKEDVDELVIIADRALYRAKERGRDQVAVGIPTKA